MNLNPDYFKSSINGLYQAEGVTSHFGCSEMKITGGC